MSSIKSVALFISHQQWNERIIIIHPKENKGLKSQL